MPRELGQWASSISGAVDAWFRHLTNILKIDSLPWSVVNKTGSNLTDIETRNHNDLQSLDADDAHPWDSITKTGSELQDIATRPHSQLTDVAGSTDAVHVSTAEAFALTALEVVSGNGILVKDSMVSDSYNVREIVGTTGEVEVSEGKGYQGNPTISLPTTISGPRRFGGETNYAEFEEDGTLEFNGAATVWEDLRVEPSVRGGVRQPAFEKWFDDSGDSSIGVFLYSFTDEVEANQKEIHFTMQMPHAWMGTDIHIHVHWVGNLADTSATPYWGLEYIWADIGATFNDTTYAFATGNGPGTPDTDITANKHYISSFSAITPSASQDGISSVLIGRLYRNSAATEDTYNVANNKCGLLYIDAHYEVSTCGSRTEFSK